jgi:hypothetical protein
MLNECIGDNAFIEPFAIVGLNPVYGEQPSAHPKPALSIRVMLAGH